MAALVEGPRTMLPEEYDDVMGLQERAYGYTRRHAVSCYPQLRRDRTVCDDHLILKENGRVVSHIGSYPLDVAAGECEIKVAGVGDVGTDADYRGKGYMTALMDYLTAKLKERKIPLSILWGDTQRYRHFGWETAGQDLIFQLSRRSVESVTVGPEFTVRGYDRTRDLEAVLAVHEREPLRVKRRRRDYEDLLERTQDQVWVGNEKGSWGYAVLNGMEVIEFGGELPLIPKLFSLILKYRTVDGLNVHVPCRNSDVARMLHGISSTWQVVPLGLIKIIDLKQTLSCFRAQIEQRARSREVTKGGRITLHMRDSGQAATLAVGDRVEIEEQEAPDAVTLSDMEMARLLFGGGVENRLEKAEQEKLLRSLFPLDFYVWGLDHV